MTTETINSFFESKVPKNWFEKPPTVEFDDDEILVIGAIKSDRPIDAFREETRAKRMAIAGEAEARFHRKVSWGVEDDGKRTLFTTASVPVTTRLRFSERTVLDTLVDAGVARSRSDALGWCVKLVARHEAEWLTDLRGALVDVERVRAEGPTLI